MARRMVIAGNWKMNMTPNSAVALIKELIPLVQNDDVDVALCVPDLDILPCIEAVQGTNIGIGSQNMYFEEKGAFTGEIAPDMLTDVGVEYVILGHSERRSFFAETDETVNKKVLKAFEHDITLDLIRMQIKIAFYNVKPENAKKAIVAYEPIWAIGTGVGARTDQAQEVCKAIRDCLAEIYDEGIAQEIRILYGGSVSSANAADLFEQPDIDGGLVGGASLKPDFGRIVNYKSAE